MAARREPENLRVLAGLAILLAVWTTSGCDHCKPEFAAREEVLRRLNANTADFDFLMKASGDADATIDHNGQIRRFDMEVILLFRKPDGLWLRLRHSLANDVQVQIGSNEREFWLWDCSNPDYRRYFTGRHHHILKESVPGVELLSTDLAQLLLLLPRHLSEILGLTQVPLGDTDPRGPFFRVLPENYELIFLDEHSSGDLYISKVVHISRCRPPYLPYRVILYAPDGYEVATAHLSARRTIDGTEILLPHVIELGLAGSADRLRLTFDLAQPLDSVGAERHIDESPYDKALERPGYDLGRIEWLTIPPSYPPRSQPSTTPSPPGDT
jgi:hypothetical protein